MKDERDTSEDDAYSTLSLSGRRSNPARIMLVLFASATGVGGGTVARFLDSERLDILAHQVQELSFQLQQLNTAHEEIRRELVAATRERDKIEDRVNRCEDKISGLKK